MIPIYLLGSILISALLFLNRNKRINYLLV